MTKPTILIAGATGYLGSRLLRSLVESGQYDCAVLKRCTSSLDRIDDLLPAIRTFDIDRDGLAAPFDAGPVEIIVNCATNYGRGPTGREATIAANLTFPLGLLDAANRHGAAMFVQADTSLPPDVSDYALAKHQFGQWLDRSAGPALRVRLRLEHFFGPGDDASKFVAYVINTMVTSAPKLPLTPGDQLRDFVYVDDVVDAFRTVIESRRDFEPGAHQFPVGSGVGTRIRDLVTTVKQLTDNQTTDIDFGAVAYRDNEVMRSVADLTNISHLAWRPQTSLEDGLRQTIDFERQRLGRVA
ncbi:NAD-dependent epimerase/dehydratase family protein [Blastopirellula marina]|nr:NAD(P)-dependent oxidoreductase [Blastopirellula marina]